MEFDQQNPNPATGERSRKGNHTASLKQKILVPVTGEHASFYALDMAFLLSSRIALDIMVLYLVKAEEFNPLRNHQRDFLDIIEQKVQPELREAKKWNEFKQSIQFTLQVVEDSGEHAIAALAAKGLYHFVVLWIEKPKKHFLGPVFSEKPFCLKLIGMLQCPLICVQEPPSDHTISSILLPLDDASDSLLKIKKAMDLAKALRTSISLLIILDDPSADEVSEAQRLLDLGKQYLEKHGIETKSKIIFHDCYTDTVLAYATITKAALICNGFNDPESLVDSAETHRQRKIMLYAHLPTFNYFYDRIRD